MDKLPELRVAVCDDDPAESESLAERIRNLSLDRWVRIGVFLSAEDLLASGENYDIIFLDILMGGLDGMEAARKLRLRDSQAQIVFVTSSPDYVFSGYEVNAFRYLLKPVTDADLRTALQAAQEHLQHSSLVVRSGRELYRVQYGDIFYVEAQGRHSLVCARDGDIVCPDSLAVVEGMLPSKLFFRCQKSFIVNLSWIQCIRRYEALLPHGIRVPIGRSKWPEIRRRVISHLTDPDPS